jgi:hypothetical protein
VEVVWVAELDGFALCRAVDRWRGPGQAAAGRDAREVKA